jgi:hypothetical protein
VLLPCPAGERRTFEWQKQGKPPHDLAPKKEAGMAVAIQCSDDPTRTEARLREKRLQLHKSVGYRDWAVHIDPSPIPAQEPDYFPLIAKPS